MESCMKTFCNERSFYPLADGCFRTSVHPHELEIKVRNELMRVKLEKQARSKLKDNIDTTYDYCAAIISDDVEFRISACKYFGNLSNSSYYRKKITILFSGIGKQMTYQVFGEKEDNFISQQEAERLIDVIVIRLMKGDNYALESIHEISKKDKAVICIIDEDDEKTGIEAMIVGASDYLWRTTSNNEMPALSFIAGKAAYQSRLLKKLAK
jgi:hypothetical protein